MARRKKSGKFGEFKLELEDVSREIRDEGRADWEDLASYRDKVTEGYDRWRMERKDPGDEPWRGAANYAQPHTRISTNAYHSDSHRAATSQWPLVLVDPTEPTDIVPASSREVFLNCRLDNELHIREVWDPLWLGTIRDGTWIVKHWFNRDRNRPEWTLLQGGFDFIWASNAINEQDAHHVIHVFDLTLDAIARRRAAGIYQVTNDEMAALQKYVENRGTKESPSRPNAEAMKIQQESYHGAKQTMRAGREFGIEGWEVYWPLKVPGSEFEEECVVTMIPDVEGDPIVCWVRRLRDVIPTNLRAGEEVIRPIVRYRFGIDPNVFPGIGMSMLLENMQEELDERHNQRVNFGTLANMPWGTVTSSAGLPPEAFKIKPGTLIPVDNASDINIQNFSTSTQWGFQEEVLLERNWERLASTGDVSMGRQPRRKGTATEFVGVQGENMSQIMLNIDRGLWSLRRSLEIHDRFERLTKGDKILRITGRLPSMERLRGTEHLMSESGYDFLKTTGKGEKHRGRYDYTVTGNAFSIDVRQQRESAMWFLTQVASNPLFIQMGLIQPRNAYESIRIAAESFDEIKHHVSEIITKPPDHFDRQSFDQVQEIMMMAEGEAVYPLPSDPHEEHLAVLQMFQQDMMFGKFPSQHLSLLRRHEQAHVRFNQIMGTMQMNQQLQGASQMQGMGQPQQVGTPEPTGMGGEAGQLGAMGELGGTATAVR